MEPKDFKHKGYLSEDEIYKYIKGEISKESMKKIEQTLKESKPDFQTYVSMLEGIHLMNSGPSPSKNLESFLLGVVKEKSDKTHIQILIKFIQDKVLISSSDQEQLEYRGIMTNFAMRGSMPGPISITRTVDGNEITLSFNPDTNKKGYFLDLQLQNSEGLKCILLVNHEEWEVLRDLKLKSSFDSIIPETGELELRFKKDGDIIFTIGVVLSSHG